MVENMSHFGLNFDLDQLKTKTSQLNSIQKIGERALLILNQLNQSNQSNFRCKETSTYMKLELKYVQTKFDFITCCPYNRQKSSDV